MSVENEVVYDDDYFFVLAAGEFSSGDAVTCREDFSEDNEDLILWEPFEAYEVSTVYEFVENLAKTLKSVHENAVEITKAELTAMAP